MKYSILINQAGIVKAGLHKYTDVVDWMIIDYLKDWFFAENKKTILNSEDGKQYTWVNYQHLIENMPLIKICDKHAITNRFKKLRKLGLIKTITLRDNSLYFILTEKCIQTCFFQEKSTVSANTHSKTIEIQRKNEYASDLCYHDSIGYATEIAQGVCNHDNTAQIEYQSNRISVSNNNECVYEDDSPPPKRKFLDHVLLTEEEYQKLKERLGEEKVSEYIEALNNYIAQIGVKKAQAKYKSHYHVILNWHRMDLKRIERAVVVRELIDKKRNDW